MLRNYLMPLLILPLFGLATTALADDINITPIPTDELPNQPGTYRSSLWHDGHKRSYLVHIPTSYDHARPVPLVFALHAGSHQGRQWLREDRGVIRKSEEVGFIGVFPNALRDRAGKLHWDVSSEEFDDVGFLTKLMDQVVANLRIDTRRVYLFGSSSGGFMTQRMVLERPGRIAAAAPVSATMWRSQVQKPPYRLAQPVAMMIINGKRDQLVPIEGNDHLLSGVDTGRFWALANFCAPRPQFERLDVYGGVERRTWLGGSGSAPVVHYIFLKAGHRWPVLEKPGREHSLIDLLWAFFEDNPKP